MSALITRTASATVLACALLVGWLASPALAVRSPALRPLADSALPARTDGDRFVVWTSFESDRLHIFDTVRWRHSTMPKPVGCGWTSLSQETRAAVDGMLQLWCPGETYRLVDLVHRTSRTLTGPTPDSHARFFGMGRIWLMAEMSAFADTVYVNRTTGEVRTVPRSPQGVTAYEPDVDDPELRPICAPSHVSFKYASGDRFYADGWYAASTPAGSLFVRRCDGRRTVVLERGHAGVGIWPNTSLGGGLVTWDRWTGWGTGAYEFATGRRWHWRKHAGDFAFHTRNAVVTVEGVGVEEVPCAIGPCNSEWRTYIARLPTVRSRHARRADPSSSG